eukprot:6637916-Alexandrium_andersonii.AAC.1
MAGTGRICVVDGASVMQSRRKEHSSQHAKLYGKAMPPLCEAALVAARQLRKVGDGNTTNVVALETGRAKTTTPASLARRGEASGGTARWGGARGRPGGQWGVA